MPPASSVEAVWKVADFGAFKSVRPVPAAAAACRANAVRRRQRRRIHAVCRSRPKPEVAKQVPLRVPFGRGPKDRSVELERRDKVAERPAAPQQAAAQAAKALTMPEITMLEAIRQALFEEMERDPAVVAIGEDIGVYGGAFKATEGLLAKFGHERVIDTPISETAIVGAACGMSYLGLRPVAEMQFIDFIACCFNQVTNFVAKSHYRWGAPVPMVVRGPSGGGVHGGPFHSANPEMYFVHTPGLKVVYPSTAYDAKGLLKSAIRDNNPVLFFEHKFLYRRIKEEVPSGRLHRAHRQSRGSPRGQRPDDRQLRGHGACGAGSRRHSWRKKASKPR